MSYSPKSIMIVITELQRQQLIDLLELTTRGNRRDLELLGKGKLCLFRTGRRCYLEVSDGSV